MKEIKEKIRKGYIRKIKLLLASKQNGGNILKALNTWTIAVLRYTLLEWTKKGLEHIDRKTHKIRTINRALSLKANVARLSLPRKTREG